MHILVLCVLFAVACEDSSFDNPHIELMDMPITIGSSVSVSRATTADVQRDGFGVWAFITNSENTNDPYMENLKVEYIEDEERWDYGEPKYWLYETQFSFIATYPYGNIYTLPTVDGQPTGDVQLTLSETPSDTDYLVALSSVNTGDTDFNPSASVDLQFKHLLSNVSLNVWRDHGKHQSDQMRVRKVTLSNIRKAGTYSSATKLWTPTNVKLTMEYTNNTIADSDNIDGAIIKNDGSLETNGKAGFEAFSEQMLLPQTIDASNSVSLKIEYELKRQNAADWEEAELETILPSITWNAGQRYTYNVVLSSVTDITVYYIQTKVDPWGTPQVGGTVIIK